MGLFNKFFGGSKSKSQSGFGLLPPEIQDAFKSLAGDVSSFLPSAGGADRFTPLGVTPDEQTAFGRFRQGFTPTADTLQSDIDLQTNPFDSAVIDEINRQAGGEFSILKGGLNRTGNIGSNRQFLGANDIENKRLGLIGKFKQDQFNKSLNNALTLLPNSRARDTENLLRIGDFTRQLDTAGRQAPIANLEALARIFSVLPQSGGSINKSSSTPGVAGLFSGGQQSGGAGIGNLLKAFV